MYTKRGKGRRLVTLLFTASPRQMVMLSSFGIAGGQASQLHS